MYSENKLSFFVKLFFVSASFFSSTNSCSSVIAPIFGKHRNPIYSNNDSSTSFNVAKYWSNEIDWTVRISSSVGLWIFVFNSSKCSAFVTVATS